MSKQIRCYVVNLASAVQRREAMQARLAEKGIQAEFFSAVDGRIMNDDELESHVDRDKAQREYGPLTRAEIGTSLSHIHIYRDMVLNNVPHAVILEDDVCLSPDFAQLLSTDSPNGLARHVDAHIATMVQLSHVNRARRGAAVGVGTTGHTIVSPYGAVWLTSGYLITLAAAKQLSQALYPVWAVADYWVRFQEKGLVQVKALTPNAVWESAEAQVSSISPERRPRPKPRKTWAARVKRIAHELFTKPFLVRRLPKQQ